MSIITLTTDFGLVDSYVGAMKGVILGLAPDARIVDISHHVPPQNVQEAAYILQGAAPFFPRGTIHVVVVDPGVGSQRRPIAVQTSDAFFVGPDNGVFSFLLAPLAGGGRETGDHAQTRAIHLDSPGYWLPFVSRTFHGRDIFAPVAAHLAAGVAFDALGTAIDDPVLLPFSQPRRLADGSIRAHVAHIDHFGNLVSDLPAAWLTGRRWLFRVAGQQIDGSVHSYAAVDPKQLLALVGSDARLEIAIRDGNAAQRLDVGIGELIEVYPA